MSAHCPDQVQSLLEQMPAHQRRTRKFNVVRPLLRLTTTREAFENLVFRVFRLSHGDSCILQHIFNLNMVNWTADELTPAA